MKESRLYRVLRPVLKAFTNIFIRPKYIGLNNIPKDKPIVLAGNHTNNLDCLLLVSSTKRSVHFLAKNELWRGPKKVLFANLGLIPVDRTKSNPEALQTAQECLNSGGVIGIFPEGTTEKGRGLMPFKVGAVKMAKNTNTKIVPFVIKGKYRMVSRDLVIKFGKPLTIEGELDKENDRLRNTIKEMLK